MQEDKVLVSIEVPRKKYYNEDILKAVMPKNTLVYLSEEGEYFSLPLKIENKKQTELVIKIIRDYITESRKKLTQKTDS